MAAKKSSNATLADRWLGADGGEGGSRWRSLGVICGVMLFTVLIGWFALHQVWAHVVNMEDFRVNPSRIDFSGISWLDGNAFRKDLLARDPGGFLDRTYSILEKDLAEKVAIAYERSPWVRRVQVVNKEFPNKLRIQLELRRPYMEVEAGGRNYLLDFEGVVLDPAIYRQPRGGLGRPPVKLAYAVPEPRVSSVWPMREPGVKAALEMQGFMESKREMFDRLGVAQIAVRREGVLPPSWRSSLVLRTTSGADILWGGSPLVSVAGAGSEVTAGDKLRRIDGILGADGARLSLFEYIDVRWDRPAAKKRDLPPGSRAPAAAVNLAPAPNRRG